MKKAPPDYDRAVQSSHPTIEFIAAADRLSEDHIELKAKLLNLYKRMKQIVYGIDSLDWDDELNQLKSSVVLFMRDLDDHSRWEEANVFPMVALYMTTDKGVLSMMEEDHELAKQYLQAFLSGLEQLETPVSKQDARHAVAYLLEAYEILSEHFTMEEELIVPLTDRILTDIDYIFS